MCFVPCSKITVGGKTFKGVNEVNVKRSIFEIGATASIKVPVTAILRQEGQPPTYVETAQAIKVGDPVEIQLGYNGSYMLEFVGYESFEQWRNETRMRIIFMLELFETVEKRSKPKNFAHFYIVTQYLFLLI